ncbi:MAG: S41 family peptidase [Bacteroidales bacterium]|jgi:C-terminal processing protease CtpA/Prc|nr:S41 family peptidase [Bacteroidales bacterium]MDD2770716.1 S41 family peptidase [Bacteroidales bacterium]MDD3104737.1 S41 family peptidase [Bacteroidales bacterium]MDD3549225.1 S41 family peptidase [Bacteroidales bacterium]MDD4064188.1 S41 family peptidase [Bacteroidales bacterium]
MKRLFILFSLVFLLTSCEWFRQPEEAPPVTQKVNTYMLELMKEVYLWETHILDTFDIRYEFDEFEFFEKLCYRTEDRWSFLTDDVQSLLEGGEGVETTFGYSLAFGTFSNTGNYFAVIQYVYPQTPATEAGLKRGSIIIEMNGNAITRDNYTDLYYSSSLSLTLGELQDGVIHQTGTVNLTARKQNLNPVIASTVIDNGSQKTGYICYTDFFGNSETLFYPVFQEFKAAGITDLVLDLRYNLGGYLSVAAALVGVVCPSEFLTGNTVLISKTWNDLYQDYWADNNRDDMLHEYFPKFSDVPVNLNLSRIYILTGYNTASASELTICGLDPYMEVIKIGDVTRGKYTAAMIFNPEEDPEIENWGTQAIVYKYANAEGVTDFKNGFSPDYPVEDVLMGEVYSLGDPRENLFKTALSLIGTNAPSSVSLPPTRNISGVNFDRSFSSKMNGLNHHLIDTKKP